jgi:tetratricopeptide (TPR) repeat protein
MATTNPIQYEPGKPIRVFLASPGDVPDERAFVREHLREILPNTVKRLGQRDIAFEVVSWDDKHDPLTMPAHLTPQQAVIEYKGAPRDCDIVIVIVAGRLGTHLSPDTFEKPDKTAYQSGTEWEYLDAWTADPRPHVLVFRRTDLPDIKANDRDRREKNRQLDLVEAFFATFTNPDGSARGGYQTYAGIEDFKTKFRTAMETIIPTSQEQSKPQPAEAYDPIPLPDLCFGRDTDIATITAALTPGAAVFVHGPGGIGKTTITQEAAHHDAVKARFLDRRWFVELDTATDRDTFDAQLLLGLHLDPTAGFAAAAHRLGQAPALLVLDNLETPWEAAPLEVEARISQLAAVPGLTLLASFRGDEHVGGARWSPRHPVAPLSDPDARALFLEIAGAAKSTDPDLPAFLDALGGVPLAICLTARRAARPPTLAGLWREWGRLGPEVASLTTGTRHRLTSVPHSIALSLGSSRMTPDAHRLFATLGQCPAGLAPLDRIALLGDAAFTAEEALRGTGLAHLRPDHRLDLLPPVRDHARRAHQPEDADATAWCRHFLDRAGTEGGKILWDGGAEALAALTPEVANIDAALRAAPGLGLRQPAVAALEGVRLLLSASGVGSPAVLTALADASRAAADAAGEAACHYWHARISLDRSDHELARARYEEALPLYRRVGDVVGEANCIQSLGDIARDRSDHELARARYEEALPLYRRVGAVLGEANCIKSLGNIALRRSDHELARGRYEEALPLYRRVGDVLGEANCIQSLGDIARRRSDHELARARYEEALPLYRRVGDVVGEANCILGQGRVAAALGDTATARARAAAALALYHRVHATHNIAITHEDLAAVTEGTERAAHVAAAKAAWREMGLEHQVADVERRFG